jgi:Tol biopolymer transport system component
MRFRSSLLTVIVLAAMSAWCGHDALAQSTTVLTDPSFSADGKRVAFVETVRSGINTTFTLMTMNVDGSDVKIVTSGQLRSPRFSPDGKSIVFSRVAEALTEDVWITSFDGKNVRALTQTPDLTEVSPSFMADGRVAFIQKPTPAPTGAVVSISPEAPTVRQKELFPADLGISYFHANADGSFLVVCTCNGSEKGLVKSSSKQVQAFRMDSLEGPARSVLAVFVTINERIAALSTSSNARQLMYSVRNPANRGQSMIEDYDSSPSYRQTQTLLNVDSFDVAPDGSKIIASGVQPQRTPITNGLWIYDFATRVWRELRLGKPGTY